MTDKSPLEVAADQEPANKLNVDRVSLPKGGGALKGLGESYKHDNFSGTGSINIPLNTFDARGFEPEISLNYRSTGGNGPFGLGFDVNLLSISRKTNLGIPRYRRGDRFVLSSGEELVPMHDDAGKPITKNVTEQGVSWTVAYYVVRFEKDYPGLEFWVNDATGVSKWQIRNGDNMLSVLGESTLGRVANPDDPQQVFTWLVEHQEDAHGNKIEYLYKGENSDNVENLVFEKNRIVTANRYISEVRYGNYLDDESNEQFAYRMCFNYGEYDAQGQKTSEWAVREDPFSSYNAGFEIRTYRLCQSILCFNYFKEHTGEQPLLVRKYELTYQADPVVSKLIKMQEIGVQLLETGAINEKSSPALLFSFSQFNPNEATGFKKLEVDGGYQIPGYLDKGQYLPVDLYGEGISGIVHSVPDNILYYEPLGDGKYNTPQSLIRVPTDNDLTNPTLSLSDLNGDFELELVVDSPQKSGFYKIGQDHQWKPFTPFKQMPTLRNGEFVEHSDLTGDGRSDILQVEESFISIYPSEGYTGYGEGYSQIRQEGFPHAEKNLVRGVVAFQDMFGDGLSHRVEIRSGSVLCWPSYGYGNFGPVITMGNAPSFAKGLAKGRLKFADIDGTGTTDLAYVHHDQVEIYINQSGNSFADPVFVTLPEPYSDLDEIQFADVTGNGTTSLVFTKIDDTPRHYFIDFTGFEPANSEQSLKPYLLTTMENGSGLTTSFEYKSSTSYYLEDKKAGKPWVSKLAFPIQLISKTTLTDKIAGTVTTNSYSYHNGFYDVAEREFRGFGYVETTDSQTYEEILKSNNPYYPVEALDKNLYVPPVLTRQWYHTGAYELEEALNFAMEREQFNGDLEALDFPPSIYEVNTDTEAQKQSRIALAGRLIREEIFEVGNGIPYSVEMHNYRVQALQEPFGVELGVFRAIAMESIDYQYDQDPTDPQVTQSFVVGWDNFGHETESCLIYLPRRTNAQRVIYPEQLETTAILNVTEYINIPEEYNDITQTYRYISIPYENRSYQLFELDNSQGNYFGYEEVRLQVADALQTIIPYSNTPDATGLSVMLTSWQITLFWNEEQTDALSPGFISSRALLHHIDKASFSDIWVADTYGNDVQAAEVSEIGGYFFNLYESNYWWNRGEVTYYYDDTTPQAFFQVQSIANPYPNIPVDRTQDPSLAKKEVLLYDGYYLNIQEIQTYYSENDFHRQVLEMDYQCVQVKQLTDINDNIHQYLFDPLGELAVVSIIGTEAGDSLTGGMRLYPVNGQPAEYTPRLHATDGGEIGFEDVVQHPDYYLQGATHYYFYEQMADNQPAGSILLIREEYYTEQPESDPATIRKLINYYDGSGRSIERKINAEPGPALQFDKFGTLKKEKGRFIVEQSNDRWLVSGRVVYNNKGEIAEEYIPYFSNIYQYETQEQVTASGAVPPPWITHYDAIGRVVRKDTPKGFFNKTIYSPWQTAYYDENDTVTDAVFYKTFMASYPGNPTVEQEDEKDALDKAALCYNTPLRQILDSTGSIIREIKDNLGKVSENAFESIVQSPITSVDVWNELVNKGYLDAQGYLTDKYQPYFNGFSLQLDPVYESIKQGINDILLQGRLTTFIQVDVEGRQVLVIDPRLYYENTEQGTSYYSLKNEYPMDETEAWSINSSDAGLRKVLKNIFENNALQFDPNNIKIRVFYDHLQRPLRKYLTETDGTGEVIWSGVVERIEYGDGLDNAASHNLIGQIYRLYDQAGIITIPDYNIQNRMMTSGRQLAVEYKNQIDWSDPGSVPMEPDIYTTDLSYNALALLIDKTTPDGTKTNYTYNLRGLVEQVYMKFADSTEQTVIESATYDEFGTSTRTAYANGSITTQVIENTTANVRLIRTTRAAEGDRPTVLQNIAYTYDPVDNPTRSRDSSIDTIYNGGQEIEPLSDYTYDCIYQLKIAIGRQHQALGTSHTSGKYGQFIKNINPNDAEKLENYTEQYTYDNSGNLTLKKHTAASGTWSMVNEISDGNNLLKNVPADEAGNMLKLKPESTVNLSWDYAGNLSYAGIIERPDNTNDADYFRYNPGKERVRKVIERLVQETVTEIDETIYIGNFQIYRTSSVSGNTKTVKTERQMLRVMNKSACALVRYYWKIGNNEHPTGTSQLRYQLDNLQNSVSLETDTNADIISYEEYFPFGGTAILSGQSTAEVKLKFYHFTGKERDNSTGLYYYGARYYAPWMGRWLNPDPGGPIDGLNLLAYVSNNPLKYTDPSGYVKVNKKAQLQSSIKSWTATRKRYKTEVSKWKFKVSVAKNATAKNAALLKLKSAETQLKRAETRLKNLKNDLAKLSSGASYTTSPAFYNPGGPSVIMNFQNLPSAQGATKLAGKPGGNPYIVDFYDRVNVDKKPLDAQTQSDVRNYTALANKYIASQGGSITAVSTDRKLTGSLGYQAGQIASKERKGTNTATPNTYPSGNVVGHVPDVSITGVPYSFYGWFSQTKLSNSLVGGGVYAGRVIDQFVVRELDGNYYKYT
ncbi:hypothetical protein JMN32_19320 [Fulvivirga sp. 29W222]|uniref:Uncharacterized protein n=1 Tax=Fulvivirga marina TaxID=2494733 RepID=A0A937KDC7_9BACT|nr:SpvB/TcaC N-terminal domain-containing protein [Fulvivirga marina]MBL6448472.1 hypothetical protein [Fulvivirga marina]